MQGGGGGGGDEIELRQRRNKDMEQGGYNPQIDECMSDEYAICVLWAISK